MYLEFDWTFHFRKNSSQYHWKNKNYHIRLNIFCRLLLIFIQSHLCFLKNHFFQNHFLFFKLSPQRAAVVSEPYSLFPYTKIDRKQSTITTMNYTDSQFQNYTKFKNSCSPRQIPLFEPKNCNNFIIFGFQLWEWLWGAWLFKLWVFLGHSNTGP